MKFLDYLENKVFYILFQIFSIIFLALILFMANFSFYYINFIITNFFNNRLCNY